MTKIYVASSWRNVYQPTVVGQLKKSGFEVYDFRHPEPGNEGFHWSELDPDWEMWSTATYLKFLVSSHAEKGYALDRNAMEWAEVGVLVLPAGNSAHLEAGYFHGHPDKKLHVLFLEAYTKPDLMYKMADWFHTSIWSLIQVLNATST